MKSVFNKIVFSFIVLNLLVKITPAREVTNEEIRDGILSLVHSFNLLDNKLERHEHRERTLGELVKRSLQSLQKGQKAYEPMNGSFSRLDERVSQIETILIAQEEKYNVQTDKLSESLQNIFKWMAQNSACNRPPGGNNNIGDSPNDKKLQELTDKVEKLSKTIENLTKASKDISDQTEILLSTKLSTNNDVITRLEDKLTHFYVTTPTTQPPPVKDNTEFENNVKDKLSKIETNIAELEQKIGNDKLSGTDKDFLQGLTNETLHEINNAKQELSKSNEKLTDKTFGEMKTLGSQIDNNLNKVYSSLSESNQIAHKLFNDVNESYSNLRENFEVFNKFDKILLTTSDYVLDTQRKVEYGTHQILQKVGELLRIQYEELNVTLQKRFNDIDNSIVNNHLEALQNLSSTLDLEISHVWRQIEIMHSEIKYSKDALNKLQGQTEQYVNGTISTMDSMEGKVSHVTERMTEIDSNLNYLLGKLSLITQEFNQIKTGLGSALDQIRTSFKTVQDKVKDVGPGPHPIIP